MNITLTIRFILTGIALVTIAASCKMQAEKVMEQEIWQKKLDSFGNVTLDSFYAKELQRYDSLKRTHLPSMIDSIIADDLLKSKK